MRGSKPGSSGPESSWPNNNLTHGTDYPIEVDEYENEGDCLPPVPHKVRRWLRRIPLQALGRERSGEKRRILLQILLRLWMFRRIRIPSHNASCGSTHATGLRGGN